MNIKGTITTKENKKYTYEYYGNWNSDQILKIDEKIYCNPDLELIESELESIKAKEEVNEISLNEEEKQIGIDYVKNNFPITYELVKNDINQEYIEYFILWEFGGLKDTLECLNGYFEGDTGIYGNNLIYEELLSHLGYTVATLIEEDIEEGKKYILECIKTREVWKEFECFIYPEETPEELLGENEIDELYKLANKEIA